MAEENTDLFNAFAEDHSFLGKTFHELSQALRGSNTEAARHLAARLDKEAGAHIAFEEENFYPTLAGLVGETEVQVMFHEHQDGLSVVQQLCDLSPASDLSDDQRIRLLRKSEVMESHIAECGNLFEAMGRLTAVEQEELHEALIQWRLERPSWRRHAAAVKEKKSDRGGVT
jgi:hypothetical protein